MTCTEICKEANVCYGNTSVNQEDDSSEALKEFEFEWRTIGVIAQGSEGVKFEKLESEM